MLFGCETWSLGCDRAEVSYVLWKLHNEELHNRYTSLIIIRIVWSRSMRGDKISMCEGNSGQKTKGNKPIGTLKRKSQLILHYILFYYLFIFINYDIFIIILFLHFIYFCIFILKRYSWHHCPTSIQMSGIGLTKRTYNGSITYEWRTRWNIQRVLND
jgi:hypothetical protein